MHHSPRPLSSSPDVPRPTRVRLGLPFLAALTAWMLVGCADTQYADPNPKKRFVFPGEQPGSLPPVTPPTAAPRPPTVPPLANAAPAVLLLTNTPVGTIRVGEMVTVTFADLPNQVLIPESKIRIAEDGKITLHFNVTVHAAGKTTRQLEQEIRSLYVPKYYNYMTVTIKTDERMYFVGGEVKNPNRQFYTGPITVLRAIDTAGGFTDFANRSNIEMTRQGGEKVRINYKKALRDPKLDPEVYPNDQIIVHRRW